MSAILNTYLSWTNTFKRAYNKTTPQSYSHGTVSCLKLIHSAESLGQGKKEKEQIKKWERKHQIRKRRKAAVDGKSPGQTETTPGHWWWQLRPGVWEAHRVGCREHIKVKARTQVPFCWFLFDSEKLWQSGEGEGWGLNAWKHRVHQRTSLGTLRYCFLFQQYKVWLQQYLGGLADPYPRWATDLCFISAALWWNYCNCNSRLSITLDLNGCLMDDWPEDQ